MLATIVVIAFVVAVLGIAAYALFELSPYARHSDSYRDPATGTLHFAESPHLETRDEFERRTSV